MRSILTNRRQMGGPAADRGLSKSVRRHSTSAIRKQRLRQKPALLKLRRPWPKRKTSKSPAVRRAWKSSKNDQTKRAGISNPSSRPAETPSQLGKVSQLEEQSQRPATMTRSSKTTNSARATAIGGRNSKSNRPLRRIYRRR